MLERLGLKHSRGGVRTNDRHAILRVDFQCVHTSQIDGNGRRRRHMAHRAITRRVRLVAKTISQAALDGGGDLFNCRRQNYRYWPYLRELFIPRNLSNSGIPSVGTEHRLAVADKASPHDLFEFTAHIGGQRHTFAHHDLLQRLGAVTGSSASANRSIRSRTCTSSEALLPRWPVQPVHPLISVDVWASCSSASRFAAASPAASGSVSGTPPPAPQQELDARLRSNSMTSNPKYLRSARGAS